LAQSQMLLQLASQSPPGTFNMPEVNKAILNAANVDNPDRFLIQPQQEKQQDPLADIMTASKGMPIKAFPGQDHDSHIAVKTAYLQDPLNGANEVMKLVQPVLMANVREHMVLRFQEQMGGMMKANEGQVDEGGSLGMIMAQSAQQILQANQLAAQGGLDSIEQQNLNMQKQAMENKREKDKVELALADKELQLKAKEINIDAMVEAAKLEEKKEENNEKLSAKIISDLLKLSDKQKLAEGGVASAGAIPTPADQFKQAADVAAMPTSMIPPTVKRQNVMPKNFLEQAFEAQGIDPQRTTMQPMTIEPKPKPLTPKVPIVPIDVEDIPPLEQPDLSALDETIKQVKKEKPMAKEEMLETDEQLLNNLVQSNITRLNLKGVPAEENLETMAKLIGEVESNNNPKAKNKKSSAKGEYQYTNASVVTAVNRLANRVGEENLPQWAKDSREHKDVTKLTPLQQKILFYADTFEKPGSDEYLTKILSSGDQQALEDLYFKLHHTNPDEATNKRFEKIASKYKFES